MQSARGKRAGILALCGILLCGVVTGCNTTQSKTENSETTTEEGMKDMENSKSRISGMIAVSTREEQKAVDETAQKLFTALEAGDEKAIRELFSPYALENAADLDEKIRELIAYYPGADGGYNGAAITVEDKEYGKILHVLEPILTVTNGGEEYQVFICLQMRNDFDPSREGVHLIEVIREEEKPDGFHWKEYEEAPGVYVAE